MIVAIVWFVSFFLYLASDISVYEEVEPFNGVRPVIVCGVLANRITDSLTEGYPNMFYPCTNGKCYDVGIFLVLWHVWMFYFVRICWRHCSYYWSKIE